jgi:hypothetical protein
MVTIQARRDDQTWNEAVLVSGVTLAHAVRIAVRQLGLGVGRTLARENVGANEWRWNWSGRTLHVKKIEKTT